MKTSDIITIIVNGILGLAVVILTWRTIALTKQSMKQEKKRRHLETNIALYANRFEVLRFLNELIYNYSDDKYSSEVYHNMIFSATYLFPEPIGDDLTHIFDAIFYYYSEGKEPTKYLERYKDNELMKDQIGPTRIKQAFYLEYMFISFKCTWFMKLAKDYKVEFPEELYKNIE